jgi:peptide/nickel transport system substrate-binding protein
MSTGTVKPVGEPSPENWHRFGLPAADTLLAELQRTTDPERERRLSAELQRLFVEHAPALPLFPGPLWGEYNNARIVGFPDADNPYAPLSPNWQQALLVLPELAPR